MMRIPNNRWADGEEAEIRRLSGHAGKVLKRMCAVHADRPFQEGKCELLRPLDMTGAEFRLALAELRRCGWVGAARKIGGERMLYIPPAKLEDLQSRFFPVAPAGLEPDAVSLAMETGPGLGGELFRALLFAVEEGLPLTSKGAVHRKHAAKLAARLRLEEEHVRGLALRSPYPDDYPLQAVFAIDLLLHLGLLERRERAFSPAPRAVEEWMGLDEREMSVLLLKAVSRRYGPRTAPDRHFRRLIARPEFIPGVWYSLADIMDWMKARGLAAPGETAALTDASAAWLRCLTGLGWGEIGSSPEGGSCFRWTSAKPQEEALADKSSASSVKIIVQPDLEVLVPEAAAYRLRWSLACFAEPIQTDSMWSYRLTRERLEKASGRGLSPDDVLAWLEGHAEAGLSDSIKAVIGGWSREIGRTALAETLLLSCRSEQDADALAGHPRLQGALERIGARHFTVARDRADLVRKELAAAGMTPLESPPGDSEAFPGDNSLFRLPPEIGETGRAFTLPPDSNAGLWYGEEDCLTALPTEPPPSLESAVDLWPDWAEVPSAWIKESRRYHASTARLLVEQALKWETKVRLTMEGRTCDFIPSRIMPGTWRVSGYLLEGPGGEPLERELSSEDWDRIQLVVPPFRGFPSSAPGGGCGMIG